MNSDRKYMEKVVKLARKTKKAIKELEAECGTHASPVNTDLVKTLKAMFYEEVLEVLKERKREEDA